MNSIGNDIIDLKYIDKSRTADARFYSRIVTASEHVLFEKGNLSFENFVWLLWSIKESVYKCQKRNIPEFTFSPLKMDVRQVEFSKNYSEVIFQDNPYEQTDFCGASVKAVILSKEQNLYSRSLISSRFIFTVVKSSDDFGDVSWGIKFINTTGYVDQSLQVKDFVLSRFQEICLDTEMLRIEKTPIGYPVLLKNSSVVNIPISFSHHFNLISYCFSGGISSCIDDTK
jgi:phosphopantetheinyl transferase (holo-ACP synthase)